MVFVFISEQARRNAFEETSFPLGRITLSRAPLEKAPSCSRTTAPFPPGRIRAREHLELTAAGLWPQDSQLGAFRRQL